MCSVEQGGLDGHFVLSFKANADDLLVTEAQELAHMTSYPEVATDMTVGCKFSSTRGGEYLAGKQARCEVGVFDLTAFLRALGFVSICGGGVFLRTSGVVF